MRALVAIPVFNEEKSLGEVLTATLAHPVDVLVVDDGSTDDTPKILAGFPQVQVIRHLRNKGYGAALRAAFARAVDCEYPIVITLDSDGQHTPSLIPALIDAARHADIVSGSRYLEDFATDTPAPIERRRINTLITEQLNARLGLTLTDSFCGFKAYRAAALAKLVLTEDGYAMPLELWVEAACHGLTISEIAVPRVYIDPSRSFGEVLDDADVRLAYYMRVIERATSRARRRADCRAGQSQFSSDPAASGPRESAP